MENIIKNRIRVSGNNEDFQRMLNEVKGKNTDFDFNKIIPCECNDDLELDKEITEYLNVYLDKNKDKSEQLVKTFEFFGLSREYPTRFEKTNIDSSKYSDFDFIEINSILNRISNKRLFNGFMIRHSAWGTSSNAINVEIDERKIKFLTYYGYAENVIRELSKQYPRLTFRCKYKNEEKITEVAIQDGEVTVLYDSKLKKFDPYTEISQNVLI